MSKKYIVLGGGHNIKITDSKLWNELMEKLTNPAAQESNIARKKFFEECDKLFITTDSDETYVSSDKINTNKILEVLCDE